MSKKVVYTSPHSERSFANVPVVSVILLMIIGGYFYYQSGELETTFIVFAMIAVVFLLLYTLSFASFDIYKDRIEYYYPYKAKDKKVIAFKDISRIEYVPSKYNDWSMNKIILHTKDKKVKLDAGNKYIEVLKALNSIRQRVSTPTKKKSNYYVDKALKGGAKIEFFG